MGWSLWVTSQERPQISALRRSRRAAAAADFLVGAPPTQYIEVSIFSWTVL